MISPQEALERVRRHCAPLDVHTVRLADSLGCALAENIQAPFPLPRFDNSAMDGYALRARDTTGASAERPVRLAVTETIHAGESGTALESARACRIMTGAPIPRGADTVVPIEDARIEGDTMIVEQAVERLRHVRQRGEEVQKGERVLERGITIHPGVIATLASVGRDTVRVVRKPRVAVIATGDEAAQPGSKLGPAQIFDSNSPMIVALLRQAGIEPVRVRQVGDRRGALLRAVRAALECADVLIVTGGVSVGAHDHVRSVLAESGIEEVFWRVSQKPGKPLYFGVGGGRRVFGLPGNPASAFVCFYVYVYPALCRLAGLGDDSLPEETLAAADAFRGDSKRWQFLRGNGAPGGVRRLPGQGSTW